MVDVFPPIFVVDTKILYSYNFVALLRTHQIFFVLVILNMKSQPIFSCAVPMTQLKQPL